MSDTPPELAAAKREIGRLRAENFALKRSLAERERDVADLRSSTSWRITAPLRTLVNALRRRRWLRRARRRAPAARRSRSTATSISAGCRAIPRSTPRCARILPSGVEALAARPLISVIMPSYNIDPKWMREAIESVRNQIYPHWELCISDDASTLPGVRELIETQAAQDKRIRVTFRATNGHISANSNTALDLATGDYVALLDADDVLTEDALFWVAHEIALDPPTDMIFSDEDKIDQEGRRFDPYFKPAWNPALMLGQNMFCHLGVYRRSLVEQVGRFREGFEGAQDHDLALRCADATTPERIRHIPRVLYHWRATAQSTAATLESKPYALDGRREDGRGSPAPARHRGARRAGGDFLSRGVPGARAAAAGQPHRADDLAQHDHAALPAVGAGQDALREFRTAVARDRSRSRGRPRGMRRCPRRRARARAHLPGGLLQLFLGEQFRRRCRRAAACCASSTTTWK